MTEYFLVIAAIDEFSC